MTSAFTFVNTVDAPSLSASSSKAMRAHVTKTNFANRRKRIAVEGLQRAKDVPAKDPANRLRTFVEEHAQPQVASRQSTGKSRAGDRKELQVRKSKQRRLQDSVRLEEEEYVLTREQLGGLSRIRPADPFLTLSFLINHFAPVMFPSESSPDQPSQQLWAKLLVNEPALCEATLAIGTIYRPLSLRTSKDPSPEGHVGNAISIINSRLSDPQVAISDGVLTAVFTLSVWEQLKGDSEMIWGVHIDGLAKMIALRHAQGEKLPGWLSDALIYNGFSVTSRFQKQRYQKVLDAMSLSEERGATVDVSLISMYMAQFLRGIELHRRFGMTADFVMREIEEPIRQLEAMSEHLKSNNHPFLHASGHAIVAFLHLSWPKPDDTPLPVLADDLRRSLQRSQIRLCSTIDLVVWKLFIGGVASEPGSEVRRYFVARLARILRTIPINSWSHALATLGRAFLPDEPLLGRVKEVWEECEAVRRARL